MASFLDQFHFKGQQEQAATAVCPAISVTAGAGSGKTLSLVGRYLHLLEAGYPLRSLAAITFTDKAAREMRSRIRRELERARANHSPGAEAGLAAEIDAARISTIHGLCAEILRSHPAEAGLDPGFTVLEEGMAAAFQAEAVESALAWAATDPRTAPLFGWFKENDLRLILAALLARRLDLVMTDPEYSLLAGWSAALDAHLTACLEDERWREAIATLEALHAAKPDDKLELARRDVLARWGDVQHARTGQDWDAVLSGLSALRKAISVQGRKDNWDGEALEAVRQAMVTLRQAYEDYLKPLAEKCRWALDERAAALLPCIGLLFERVSLEYSTLKDGQQALDFDDLEGLTAGLLSAHPEVRKLWQGEIRAVLVDEFQDTNERQRQIVYALAGFDPAAPAHQTADLFVVGDAKQSIYKFRGADVTVFRQVQQDIRSASGLAIDLDLTFRAHKALLDGLNALLAPAMGVFDDPAHPFQVPFAPLRAYRQEPEKARLPYIEFHLGLGEDAEAGRQAAAVALARRLHILNQGEAFAWGDMALLFRSSTAFGVYETALEDAGIPFVTVAGRGFYDRPEIRDLLNALAAIDDPTDDLALAGLLRSPAFALPDSDLYRLRFSGENASVCSLWDALRRSNQDASHRRAYQIIQDLHAQAGRSPVAAVLKQLLDITGYGAILSVVPGGGRMSRNVDKLLADAHRSRLVGLGDFLAYVQTLRDVGLREGEAPVDAGGAVQLMSVHKAKGLEFPLVVIADAAYEHRGGGERILPAGRGRFLIDLRDADGEFHPVAWQLAGLAEQEKEDAEDRRLLYVAATRAKEKLLVSGHVKLLKAGTLSLKGWLKRLGEVVGLQDIVLNEDLDQPRPLDVEERLDGAMSCRLYPASDAEKPAPTQPALFIEAPEGGEYPDFVLPVPGYESWVIDEKAHDREADPPQRVWRVIATSRRQSAPAWVVGKLVHEALRYWVFPGDGFDDFIRPFAVELGLTDAVETGATIREVRGLLERFYVHPLRIEMEQAERHHEVFYALPNSYGIIDILYRVGNNWFIADFKTNQVRSDAEAWETIWREGYDRQVQRYAQALAVQTGWTAQTRLVFLNVGGEVRVFDPQQG